MITEPQNLSPRSVPLPGRRLPIHAVRSARAGGRSVLLALLLGWWVFHVVRILYFTSDDLSKTLYAVESGSTTTQLEILLFGLIGLAALGPAISRLRQAKCSWPYWFLAYLFWCALSLSWSQDIWMGTKRFGVLLLTSLGAIGIGAGCYGRNSEGPFVLLRHVRWAGFVAMLLCIPALATDVSWGNLSDPAWRPSVARLGPEVGFAIAYALVASLAFLRQSDGPGTFQWGKVLTRVGAVALIAILLLLKSRSLIAFTAIAVAGLYLVSRGKTRLFAATLSVLAALVVLVVPLVIPLQDRFLEFFARGDSFQTLTQLNGRQRLWEYVWNDATQRPWTGVGFGSYWTTTRLSAVWQAVGWQAPFGHNGYLDELAATGIVGLLLFLGFIWAASRALLRRSRGPRGLAAKIAIGWLVLFLLINLVDTILQFYFKAPFIFTLAAISACTATDSRRAGDWLQQRFAAERTGPSRLRSAAPTLKARYS